MFYITKKVSPREYQYTWDDLFKGAFFKDEAGLDTFDTRTYTTEWINSEFIKNSGFDINLALEALVNFNRKWARFVEPEDKAPFYRVFHIPKKSGGLREITAPTDELKAAQCELKDILENIFRFTYHTCGMAYIRGRSTLTAVKRHQANNSRWFLKTDLHGFFPSSTKQFVFDMLYKTFPLCYFHTYPRQKEEFEKAMSIAFLHDGLPQGSKISPIISNQMLIPIDYAINKYCHSHKPHLVYTRYCDDMIVSSEFSFHWTDVVNDIGQIMREHNAPYTFSREKIHYGSNAGRNWVLGVMLNKDNAITIGHEKKKNLKNILFAFANDYKANRPWSLEDTQILAGKIAYYKQVEGDAITEIVKAYSDKTGVDIPKTIKEIIKSAATV